MSQLPAQTNAEQPQIRESAEKGIRATLGSVLVSIGLGIIKVITGIVGHSYALIADGVESLLDVVSGLVLAGVLRQELQEYVNQEIGLQEKPDRALRTS